MSAGSEMGVATVASGKSGRAFRNAATRSTFAGSIIGSSPWTFTTIAAPVSRAAA